MKKLKTLSLFLICILTLTGCNSKDSENILSFQNELNSVLAEIEYIHVKINSIDTTSADASDDALDYLSELNDAFADLAKINVTDDDHLYIKDLASEGADYMSQAYELYQKAYGNDTFDENNADLAYKYLERATKRVRVIISMLHGEVPDDVIIH